MLENMDVTIIFLSNDTVSPYLLFIVYEEKKKRSYEIYKNSIFALSCSYSLIHIIFDSSIFKLYTYKSIYRIWFLQNSHVFLTNRFLESNKWENR